MAERAAELYRWIEEGATVYVCGDAERMAPDVDAMLGRIIREQSGCDESTASERLRAMRRDGRPSAASDPPSQPGPSAPSPFRFD